MSYFLIETSAPVHTGTGEFFDFFEMSFFDSHMEVFSADSLISSLTQNEVLELSNLAAGGGTQCLGRILSFLRYKEIAGAKRVEVPKEIVNRIFRENSSNNAQISKLVTSSFTGQPYLPGSSVKGALRTALLNKIASSVKSLELTEKNKARQLESKLLEFNKINNDPLKGLKVSDFHCISQVPREILYAGNFRKRGSFQNTPGNKAFILLETISPGSKFIGSIKFEENTKYSLDTVLNASTLFYNSEFERESEDLKMEPSIERPDISHVPLRVGRHSGAECLTIDGYREIAIRTKQGRSTRREPNLLRLAFRSPSPTLQSCAGAFGWVSLIPLDTSRYHDLLEQQQKVYENEQQVFKAALYRKQDEIKRALETKEKERELEQNPWKAYLPKINSVTNWGDFRQLLEVEDISRFCPKTPELAALLLEKAEEIRNSNYKTWCAERDEILEQVFKERWQRLSEKETHPNLAIEVAKLGNWEQVSGFELLEAVFEDKAALVALRKKLIELGCNKKKVKNPQKRELFQKVTSLLGQN